MLTEAWKHTRSRNAAWMVLTALSDAADKTTAITWRSERELGEFTHLAEKSVRNGLRWLEAHHEIETRVAQRGRRRINVYRVVLGRYAEIDLDELDLDLPFPLLEPFSRPADIAGRRLDELAERMEAATPETTAGRPADIAAREDGGRPADSGDDDRHILPSRPADPAEHTSLRGPKEEPEGDPSAEQTAAAAWIRMKLERGMRQLRVGHRVRELAIADPERATAWLDVARREGKHNPAGMFADGIRGGEWPSGRGPEAAAVICHRAAKEASLRTHVAVGNVDFARELIDVEWETLTPIERAELHLIVDDLVSELLLPEPGEPAAPTVSEVA